MPALGTLDLIRTPFSWDPKAMAALREERRRLALRHYPVPVHKKYPSKISRAAPTVRQPIIPR